MTDRDETGPASPASQARGYRSRRTRPCDRCKQLIAIGEEYQGADEARSKGQAALPDHGSRRSLRRLRGTKATMYLRYSTPKATW
jgi:hypothetical protein